MIKSKRFRALALVASLGILAAACGSDDEGSDATSAPTTAAPEATTAPTEAGGTDTTAAASDTTAAGSDTTAAGGETPSGDLKLGIAYDTGGRGDGTFNDAAARGADQAKAELGYTVDELEATTDEDRKPNLETLTGNGDNPVIAVGFQFSDPLAEIAAANPNTQYAIVDGFVDPAVAPNVLNLGFAEQEGSFLVGAAAALKSETGHIGFIGGQEIDLIKRFEAGYIAGAKAVNPDIKIESKYLGPAGDNSAWGNVAGAKEIAKGWYDAGADVIYSAAGGSGAGTIQAAVEGRVRDVSTSGSSR